MGFPVQPAPKTKIVSSLTGCTATAAKGDGFLDRPAPTATNASLSGATRSAASVKRKRTGSTADPIKSSFDVEDRSTTFFLPEV